MSCPSTQQKTEAGSLSAAVRPAPGVKFDPIRGYRPDRLRMPRPHRDIPVMVVAAGADRLFDLFLAMTEILGSVVDLVLESSHFRTGPRRREYRRAHVDRAATASYLCEFEDCVVNDGCAGVTLYNAESRTEVQFDEHKAIVVYAEDRKPFRDVCRKFGLERRDDLVVVSEVPHVHRTTIEHAAMFRDLGRRFGAPW